MSIVFVGSQAQIPYGLFLAVPHWPSTTSGILLWFASVLSGAPGVNGAGQLQGCVFQKPGVSAQPLEGGVTSMWKLQKTWSPQQPETARKTMLWVPSWLMSGVHEMVTEA